MRCIRNKMSGGECDNWKRLFPKVVFGDSLMVLFDSSLIQCLLVSAGIGIMFS